MMSDVADLKQRLSALDAGHSFIVQAPAGSGKTELLIQRYLLLLSRVEAPEEITAITFTRKAAAEMRKRVIEALYAARSAEPPAETHRKLTWQLAREARARDAQLGWQIEDNAARLRIQTIDAFCASLTRQMPMLSRFGAQPESVEDSSALYREAARNTLALLENEGVDGAVARLLTHLDNNLDMAETLLAAMLRYRDQWLRNLHVASDREALEAALARVRLAAITRAHELLAHCLLGEDRAGARRVRELIDLANFAANNIALEVPESSLCFCAGLKALPGVAHEDFANWLGLIELLLTKEGTWRKALNRNIGFPPGENKAEKDHSKMMKARMSALLDVLRSDEPLRTALLEVRLLPPSKYSTEQWEALDAIVTLLPRATAELWSVFAAHGQCDFTEISQAASRALGDADAPTDLALALDYRLRHLLIDEFQDTSFSQFELLEKLTAGWQQGDGRTLFLVGDPMQSIYRFREAEVGLFLKARNEGLGNVALTPLALAVNFRSQAGIVAWVNDTFGRIMPQEEDIASGAVSYANALAGTLAGALTRNEAAPGAAVTLHPFFDKDNSAEAVRVVDLVRQCRAENAQASIAILVRNRTHLDAIVPQLKIAGLRFRAIDIDGLVNRQCVQDVIALTRALLHLADRTAWLALLRAPWCGLTLADLLAFAEGQAARTVFELMNDAARVASLSQDGQQRLLRVREVMHAALANQRRSTLRSRVEGAWLALGGPAASEDVTDLDEVQRYFDYLQDKEIAGTLPNLSDFEAGLAQLYAAPDAQADERLQIMTIHKAKGLEFDCVIVPGLGRAPRRNDTRLMVWMERALAGEQGRELLLAPIREAGTERDAIYDYIARLESIKQDHEMVRLLYVAATRARTRLHLLGGVALQDEDAQPREPKTGSLLAPLWPVAREEFARALTGRSVPRPAPPLSTPSAPALIKRLTSDWVAPAPPQAVAFTCSNEATSEPYTEEVEFSWASETAKHSGSVVHRYLQAMTQEGLAQWDEKRIAGLATVISHELAQRGVPQVEVAQAQARVQDALCATLGDERGRWTLSAHAHAHSELRLTGIVDGTLVNVAIDRTFIDEQGTRWIIDFKTGTHLGGEVAHFLDNEQLRYQAQLERYAALMQRLDHSSALPIKLGLYFPLLGGWREWNFSTPLPRLRGEGGVEG